MRVLIPLLAAATLLSCSYPPPPPGVALAQETSGRVAGPPQTCITSNPAQNLHALDAQTIEYGWGRTVYINHMTSACPGIGPTSTLIVQPFLGGQYCRGDLVHGRELGSTIPGPTCVLGNWVPYRKP